MALETATYINQLDATNPPGGDPIANAADHLRLIKAALKATFPNLGSAAVTATAAQINAPPPAAVVVSGMILMWSGSIATIPAGWVLCNGANYTRADGTTGTAPELRDRFIIAAGGNYAPGVIGGQGTVSGPITVNNTALTVDQLPNFTINISDPGHYHNVNDPGHSHVISNDGGSGTSGKAIPAYNNVSFNTISSGVSNTGITVGASNTGIVAAPVGLAGNPHIHTGSFSSNFLPYYYALAYIIKT